MDVVRDVLDKLVIDSDGAPLGRVDGIVLRYQHSQPPRLVRLLMGPKVLAQRVHPMLTRWAGRVERALDIDRIRPIELRIENIDEIGRAIKLTAKVDTSAAEAVERRIGRMIGNIPGGD